MPDLLLEGFSSNAAKVVLWTRNQLSADDRDWLRKLPYVLTVEGFTLVHASLDLPARWGYVFDHIAAAASLSHQTTPVCFFWAHPCAARFHPPHRSPRRNLHEI